MLDKKKILYFLKKMGRPGDQKQEKNFGVDLSSPLCSYCMLAPGQTGVFFSEIRLATKTVFLFTESPASYLNEDTVKEEIFVWNLISELWYNWKMYVINFRTKFSSTWFASLSIAASSFFFFGQFDISKLNSIRKIWTGKYEIFRLRKFLPLQ